MRAIGTADVGSLVDCVESGREGSFVSGNTILQQCFELSRRALLVGRANAKGLHDADTSGDARQPYN